MNEHEKSFLRGKLVNVSFGDIAFSQLESFLLWLVRGLPGLVGFAARNLIFKILFKKHKGFSWVQHGVTFVQTNRLAIGKSFGVNSGTYINAVGGIAIGDFVLIGSNVTISSGKHPIEGRSNPVFSRPTLPSPIIIEDDVWIGAGAVLMPGITLKKGTVVGANSVVTKSTEEYAVVVGAPARRIRTR